MEGCIEGLSAVFHPVGLTLMEKGPKTLGKSEFDKTVSFLVEACLFITSCRHVVQSVVPPVLG